MAAQWTTTETRAQVTFPSPTRSSYTFKRWNTNTSDTGTGYNGGSTLVPTGNMTVYAIWNPIISFNANGGSGAPTNQTKTFNSELTLSSTQPTRTGYTFSKWNTAANGSGTSYASGGTVAASMNTAMTLYAQWTANTYTISFNANVGVGAPSSISKTYGQSVTLPTDKPTRIGHTFLGWALSSSADTAQWLAGANFSEAITANTTLYAVWRDDYQSPSITTLRAYRCGFELTADAAIDPDKTYYERSGSGTSEDPYIYTEVEEPDVSDLPTYYEMVDDDEAGYARVEATWSIDTSVDEGVVNSATMTGTITPEGQPAQAITFQSGYQGTSGNAVALVEGLDVDTQYTVTVTVTDVRGASAATSRTVLLLRAFYIFDFGSQGNAVGIGRAAPQSGMEVGYPATFDDTVNLYDELQFNSEQAYPTFTRSAWDTTSDQTTLPVTPCFVLDTAMRVLYWCDGTNSFPTNISASSTTMSGSDLNDQGQGEDWWGNNFTNAPDSGYYRVIKFGAAQFAVGFTGNASAPTMYVRSNVNSIWQPWMKCLDANGDTVTGPIKRVRSGGESYIRSWEDAVIMLEKTESTDLWFPILSLRTKGGGGWAIGNYNDETLEFVYATKANIQSLTNTTKEISFGADGSGYFSGNLTVGNGTSAVFRANTPSRANGGFLQVGGGKNAAGDANGTAVIMGAGGLTIIGSGEYAGSRYNVADLADGAEQLYLGSDNNVYIEAGGQTIANRKTSIFASDGTFQPAGRIKFNSTSMPNASTSTDFFVVGFPAWASTNGGQTWYKGQADMKTWLGVGSLGAYKYQDKSNNVSCANGAITNICSLSLEAGTWLVTFHANFAANSTGYRFITITNTSNASSDAQSRYSGVQVWGASWNTYIGTTRIVAQTATTTYYGIAQQGSGGALNVKGFMDAVRIK